jgi:hypothetical protein
LQDIFLSQAQKLTGSQLGFVSFIDPYDEREKVKQYHPDRTIGLAQEIIALAEERMKEINAAYNQLIKFS